MARLKHVHTVLNGRKSCAVITRLGFTLHRATAWGIAALD